MKLQKGFRRDSKTGRPRRIDRARSMRAKRAAIKRRGKRVSMATKLKRKRSMAMTRRTHRTRSGRKAFI